MFWELEHFSNNTAVELPDGRCLTYSQLAALADEFAKHLPAHRALVFLLVGNNLESLSAYLGCLRHHHVPLLLADGIDGSQLELLEKIYRPNVIWCKSQGMRFIHDTNVAMNQGLALLLSTSGSTGSPKLVRLSTDNINSNAEAIVKYLGLTASEKAITILPMNYTYGLSVINSHLAVGASILLTDYTVIQREFWNFFISYGGTSLVGVPYTYQIFRRSGVFTKLELPSLRYMTQAGGKLPASDVTQVAEWCQKRHIKFFVMYGQTEATARMSYLPPEHTLDKSASVGVAIPGGRFAIEDENHHEIKESGCNGELIYYGPNVSLGYAEKQEELDLPDQNNGRLSTGDVAQWDEDGYVYITGRMKRFIKIAGNRIGLDDVEARLKSHGVDAVCGGKDDILAVAVTSEQTQDIIQILSNELKLHFSLIRVIVVSEIPRNEAGKIQYSQLFKGIL